MKSISRKAKQALGAIIIAAMPAVAQAQETDVKIEAKSFDSADGDFLTDKVRTTLNAGDYTLRVDMNNGRQSQFMANYDALKGGKTSLTVLTSGSFGETIDGKKHDQSLDFGGALKQNIGELPLLGKTSVKLLNINSFAFGDRSFHRNRMNVYTEHVDVAYELKVLRNRDLTHAFHVALHNDALYASFGKDASGVNQGVLSKVDDKNFAAFVWGDHNPRTGEINATYWGAYKGADLEVYSIPESSALMDLDTFNPIEVAQPIFPSFLYFGDVNHKIEVNSGKGKLKVSNLLGAKLTERLAVAAGVSFSKEDGHKREIRPALEASLDLPLSKKSSLHLDARYLGGNPTVYSYVKAKF